MSLGGSEVLHYVTVTEFGFKFALLSILLEKCNHPVYVPLVVSTSDVYPGGYSPTLLT